MKHAQDFRDFSARADGDPAGSGGDGGWRPPIPEPRPLLTALRRGWRGRCPECGGGPMFGGYLKVRARCPSCGEAFHHHRADDLPAWATVVLVGHVAVFGFFHVEWAYRPPLWVHWAVWPALTIGLALWLLPRIKGATVAMQWAFRQHGFGDGGEDRHDGGSRP